MTGNKKKDKKNYCINLHKLVKLLCYLPDWSLVFQT